MERYVALDVPLKKGSICILDEKGEVVFEGKMAAGPTSFVDLIRSKAPGVVSCWPGEWRDYAIAIPRPDRCRCADDLHGCPSCQRGTVDAAPEVRPQRCRDLADILRMVWYREVRAKGLPAHERRALSATRRLIQSAREAAAARAAGHLRQPTAAKSDALTDNR